MAGNKKGKGKAPRGAQIVDIGKPSTPGPSSWMAGGSITLAEFILAEFILAGLILVALLCIRQI